MPREIAIIDYGMGNLRSVQKGLERVGARAALTRDPERLALDEAATTEESSVVQREGARAMRRQLRFYDLLGHRS